MCFGEAWALFKHYPQQPLKTSPYSCYAIGEQIGREKRKKQGSTQSGGTSP
jgi:hypothetical protein